MQQRDYIERLIQQIVAAITRITGLAQSGQLAEAERELDDAWGARISAIRCDALGRRDVGAPAVRR